MIYSLSSDTVCFFTFTENPKENSKTLLSQGVKHYFDYLGLPSEEAFYLPSGKPVFPSGKYHLSVTHTGQFYGAVFSQREVGIDGEEIGVLKKRVADKYFSKNEKNLPFSTVWTGKEAVSKISGRGISALSEIRVEKGRAFYKGKTYRLHHLDLRGYRICVAEEE